MHLTKRAEARPESAEGWGSEPSLQLTWLIDSELGDSENGAVARMTIEPGGAQTVHRHPGAVEATVVLAGSGSAVVAGEELPLEAGDVLYAPAGAAHAIAAGEQPLDLLVVIGAANAAAAGWEAASASTAAEAQLLAADESDEIELDDARSGFVGMHARWLVDPDLCGSERLTLGTSRFAPGDGAHELHRHPETAEFFIVLDGDGVHLDEDGSEVAVDPGDAALLGRGRWHGFRNTGQREVHAVFGFLDVAGLDAAGYELPQS